MLSVLLTYVQTKIFTAQLPFFRLLKEPLQCPFDSSNWFWKFVNLPFFRHHKCIILKQKKYADNFIIEAKVYSYDKLFITV